MCDLKLWFLKLDGIIEKDWLKTHRNNMKVHVYGKKSSLGFVYAIVQQIRSLQLISDHNSGKRFWREE